MAVEVSHTKRSLVVRVGSETDRSMLRSLADALEDLEASAGPLVVDLTSIGAAAAATEFVERFEQMASRRPLRPCALVAEQAAVESWPPLPAVRVFASLEAAVTACDAPATITHRRRARDATIAPDPGRSHPRGTAPAPRRAGS